MLIQLYPQSVHVKRIDGGKAWRESAKVCSGNHFENHFCRYRYGCGDLFVLPPYINFRSDQGLTALIDSKFIYLCVFQVQLSRFTLSFFPRFSRLQISHRQSSLPLSNFITQKLFNDFFLFSHYNKYNFLLIYQFVEKCFPFGLCNFSFCAISPMISMTNLIPATLYRHVFYFF